MSRLRRHFGSHFTIDRWPPPLDMTTLMFATKRLSMAETHDDKPGGYHAYLLRLWRHADARGAWQASLQDAKSGERLGFADLEGLFYYLLGLAEGARAEGEVRGESDTPSEANRH
jgi:hypothetical protein